MAQVKKKRRIKQVGVSMMDGPSPRIKNETLKPSLTTSTDVNSSNICCFECQRRWRAAAATANGPWDDVNGWYPSLSISPFLLRILRVREVSPVCPSHVLKRKNDIIISYSELCVGQGGRPVWAFPCPRSGTQTRVREPWRLHVGAS